MLLDLFPFGASGREDARLDTLGGSIRIVHYQGSAPLRGAARQHSQHWIELTLAPRVHGMALGWADRSDRARHEPLGDLLFIPAGEPVRVWADAGPRHSSIVCEISPSAFRLWSGGDPRFPEGRPGALLNVASGAIRQILRRLAEEARVRGAASDRLVEALFVQLAIELARYCGAAAEAPVISGLAGWRLRLIDERLAQLDAPPSLAELATICGLSPRQLTRAFRSSRGQSIGEYLLHLRLEAARRALSGGASIKEIAFNLGFSSPSRFAQAFRRSFAITPQEFRRRVLHPEPGNGLNRSAGLDRST